MALHGKNIIAGQAVDTHSLRFSAMNPSLATALETEFENASASEVDGAFSAARDAFDSYSRMEPSRRADFLDAIAAELIALGPTLPQRASDETALPLTRLEGERGRTVSQLRMFAAMLREGSWVDARIDTGDSARVPLPKPDVRRMLIPLGPVAVFGASNFPLAFSVPGGDTASALAAGCTVVCKAHPAHPGTSEMCAGAIARAAASTGMPGGVFSLLHGWGHDVGLAMVRHPNAQAVAFTGSLKGGRALFDAAGARPVPIPVFAEMGSVNPVFLLPGAVEARHAELAKALSQSITVGVGQFCTNPGVLVGIDSEHLSRLSESLASNLSASPAAIMLYPALAEGLRASVTRAERAGARQLVTSTATGGSVTPTLLGIGAKAFAATSELREEMFGPVSMLVTAQSAEDLLHVARAMEGQLTATIHGTEEDLVSHSAIVEELTRKVGRLLFNQYPTGVEVGHAMQHGGPYPASTDSRTTSVGSAAIDRFVRPICYQNFPESALPAELQRSNPLGIWRMIDGARTREPLAG